MPTKKTTKKERRPSRTITFLTQEELKRLFSTVKDKRDRAIFLLAYRHGLRASEIGLLQRTDVDLKQGRITIQRLKGSISGVYPMQPDVIKLLRAYIRVSGRSRSKTYGKDCAATCGTTCPRTSLFGKDTDKSLRFFKGLRIMFSPVEPLFSGKLSHMTIT